VEAERRALERPSTRDGQVPETSSAGAVQRQKRQEVESIKHERDGAKIVVSDDWGICVRRTRVAEHTNKKRNQSTTKRKNKYAREQANNPTSKELSSAERRRERLDRADWQMMEHSDDLQENMQASMQAMSNIHTRKQMPNNMQVGVAEDQSDRRPRAVEDRRVQEPMARGSERQRTKSGRRSD
jgi:hypothetical protein